MQDNQTRRSVNPWSRGLAGALLLFPLALGGCPEEKGPMEKAGEHIDEAAGDVRETFEGIGKKDGPLERFGRQVDNVAGEAKEAGEEVGEAVKDVGR